MAKRKRVGPKPSALRIEGTWKDAVKTAVHKPRPAAGWPKPDKTRATKPRPT